MQLYGDKGSVIIFLGSGPGLMMALEQESGKTRDRLNNHSFFLLLCNALSLLGVGLAAHMVQAHCPLSPVLFLAAICSVCPLNLLCFHSVLDLPEHGKTRIKKLLSFFAGDPDKVVHGAIAGIRKNFDVYTGELFSQVVERQAGFLKRNLDA